MLKRFEVKGYKNFKDKFVLDFSDIRDYKFSKKCIKNNLLNNVIIYGKNAVGKTNFGDALFDIKSNFARENIMSFIMSDENYINADLLNGFVEFKYVFIFDGVEVCYEYSKKNKFEIIYEKLSIDSDIIFEYDKIKSKNKVVVNNLELINAETLNWAFMDDNISVIGYIINNISLASAPIIEKFYRFVKGMQLISGNNSGIAHRLCSKIVDEILQANKVKEFQNFLNEFGVSEKLTEAILPTGEKILCFNHNKPVPFINNCSSGTEVLVRLFSWYSKVTKVTFIYMDEFDAFYHYELAEKVIKLFNDIDSCQIISTSHNTNLLSNKIMRPDCFFILTKEKLISIVNSTNRELREGHNLEKLYKSGEFGE